ncbi:MAG: radical SAM protein [Dehalococcoidia bacterium]|nr:MAG: radical SAM protein [Dehalococcoidia bacterium]
MSRGCAIRSAAGEPGGSPNLVSAPPTSQVIRVQRRSRVLVSSTLTCLSTLPTINLTAGCLHDCAYCYIRGYRGYPGESTATLYEDTPERLERELERAKVKPRAVYFSPSSDLFQPHPDIQRCAERVIEILFEHGVGVAFLSKGEISERAWELLEAHASLVQAQIGLISASEDVALTFESGAAPPAKRLEQMARLVRAGIRVAARMDPVLPGITDTDEELMRLFDAVAETGVSSVSVGILIARSKITASLRRATGPLAASVPSMLARFKGGGSIAMRGAGTEVGVLPAPEREAIIDRIRRRAAARGIEIRVCACKNADITGGSCNIAGTWPRRPAPRQFQLPLAASRGSERTEERPQ